VEALKFKVSAFFIQDIFSQIIQEGTTYEL